MKPFYEMISSVCEYARRNRTLLVVLFLFLLFFYGAWLAGTNVSVDTEYLLNHPDSDYNWLSSGRFGLFFSRWLLGLSHFNPYFQNLVFLLCLWAFALFMGWLLDWLGEIRSPLIVFLFMAVTLTHPVLMEQFYFGLQRAEIAMSYLWTALALAFLFRWLETGSVLLLLPGLLSLILSLSTYQSFAVLCLTGGLGCYLLSCHRSEDARLCLRKGLTLAALFAASQLAVSILGRVIGGGSDYLSDMVSWTTLPFKTCVKQILSHLWQLVSGGSFFYSPLQGICMGGTALLALAALFRRKTSMGKRFLTAAALFALAFSPLFLTVLLGGAPMKRTELGLPFSLAWMCLLILLSLRDMSFGKAKTDTVSSLLSASLFPGLLFLLLTVPLVWVQTETSQRLIYTDNIREQSDERLAAQISQVIDSLGAELPDGKAPAVVFVGNRPADLNAACQIGESIGLSFFDIFYGNEPYYYHSTIRILDFMGALGYSYTAPSEEQVLTARRASVSMTSWPEEGSVRFQDGIVIVKLSDDLEFGS